MGLVGETAELEPLQLREMSTWIEEVLRVEKPYKRASLEYRQGEASEVAVATPLGTVMIGLHHPIAIVSSPCSVENEEMIVETAMRVKAAGAHFLRGGAYKPRTSPYAFQATARVLWDCWRRREASGLGIITGSYGCGGLKCDRRSSGRDPSRGEKYAEFLTVEESRKLKTNRFC